MMTSSPVFFIFLLLTLLLIASSDLEEDKKALLSFINSITLPPGSRYKWDPARDGPRVGPGGSRDTHEILRRSVNFCTNARFFVNAPGPKKLCSAFRIIFRKCTWSNCVLGPSLDPAKPNPCEWDGVECGTENSAVIRLKLPGASLIGKIPPDTLGKITSLRVLSLRHNGLFGPLPADFANLRQLRKVFLYNNKFSGDQLSSSVAQWRMLNQLDVSNNNFTGTIPSDINLEWIENFNLANNSFSGTLPDSFPSRLKPENFSVSNNKLSGPIPSSLARFPLKAFSDNFELCGEPLNKTCDPNKYPPPPPPKKKKKKLSIGYIVAIAVGSALILLILLLCLGKKLSQVVKEKKAPVVATMAAESAAKAERESGGGGKAGTSSS